MLRLLNATAAFLTILHLAASQTPYNGTTLRLSSVWEPLLKQWDQPFDANHRKQLADQAADMFSHAYSSYMQYGYPADNVKPKSCQPEDVQGGVAVTLLDSLDALLIFGKTDEFEAAAHLVEHEVHFNSTGEVHVFELTIRALGGLLSAHVATTDQPHLVPAYTGAFLAQARALADRLLPAFDTPTGIPLSWVSLARGQLPGTVRSTCLACATTLTLEFRLLSHLTGDRRYGRAVDAAVAAVYTRRHPTTGLLGNTLSTDSGRWERGDAGIGPGADSFYEYLLKTYLMFGDERYLDMFAEQYVRVQRYMAVPGTWRGTSWVLDVSMGGLEALKQWVSSLSAFWPGVQASVGQLDVARSLMSEFIRAQLRFGWLPEQIQYHLDTVHPQEVGYPLRPELIESAYMLWSAAREPRYLRVAEGMLGVLSRFNRCACGYCAVRNITSGELDDAMESFFLAETTKYLFLLLSNATAVNDFFIFSTEGHLLPVLPSSTLEPASTAHLKPKGAPSARTPDDVPAAVDGKHTSSSGGRKKAAVGAEDVCGDMCEERALSELVDQARAAQAEFPGLMFDPEAAQRLRRRRCRACRVVQDHLAALPALPPCDAARRLGVPLDQPCPKPPRDTPEQAAAKFAAAVHDIEKLQARMAAAVESLRDVGGASGSAMPECAALVAAGEAVPEAGAHGNAGSCTAANCDMCEEATVGKPGEGSTRGAATDTPTADPAACSGIHAEPAAGTIAGSAQHAAAVVADVEPLDFKPEDGLSAQSESGSGGDDDMCGAGAREDGDFSGPGVVAYALCMLEPKVTLHGLLQCSHTAILPAANLPVTMLPALLPRRVLIAEAAVSLHVARSTAAAVTLAAVRGTERHSVEDGGGGGARMLAVLRAAGAAFGPELPQQQGVAADSEGERAGMLRGEGFREAMKVQAGGEACEPLHEWLRGIEVAYASAERCAAAGSDNEPFRGGWAGVRVGPVPGRLVVSVPGDACQPLQPPQQTRRSGGEESGHEGYDGAIVIAHRGGCMFLEKVLHAQAVGAQGVIIVNSASGPVPSAEAGTCGHVGSEGEAPMDSSGLDVFFMDGPGYDGHEPRRDSDIPAVMVSHMDGQALIAALTCMHECHALAFSCSGTQEIPGPPECAHWQLTAELATAVEHSRSQDGGDIEDRGTASYEVSWKLITHPSLAEDVLQLEDEVGSHKGRGWEHAVAAFAPHLTALIDDWLQKHPEAFL